MGWRSLATSHALDMGRHFGGLRACIGFFAGRTCIPSGLCIAHPCWTRAASGIPGAQHLTAARGRFRPSLLQIPLCRRDRLRDRSLTALAQSSDVLGQRSPRKSPADVVELAYVVLAANEGVSEKGGDVACEATGPLRQAVVASANVVTGSRRRGGYRDADPQTDPLMSSTRPREDIFPSPSSILASPFFARAQSKNAIAGRKELPDHAGANHAVEQGRQNG